MSATDPTPTAPPATLVTPRLASSRVRLVVPDPAHYPLIREAELSSHLALRWRYRGRTPSPEEFVHRLWEGVVAQYLVVSSATEEVTGMVTCYGRDERSRFAYLAAARFVENDRNPAFFEGIALFVRHLFDAWPFHKLYLEAPEFNAETFASGIGAVLREEGRLGGHVYAGGRYWDLLVLALYRETWQEVEPDLLRMLDGTGR